jgi:hypothetical protein
MVENSSQEPENPETKDVEPGSDADVTPISPVGKTPLNRNEGSEPAPEETEPGEQEDDNIDDKGNKVGGGKLDQPV